MLLRDLLMARPCFPKIQGFFYTCKKNVRLYLFIPSLISKKKKPPNLFDGFLLLVAEGGLEPPTARTASP